MSSIIDTYIKKRAEKGPWVLSRIPKNKMYDFIICIPAYNEYNYLPYTINSILHQNIKFLNKTLIVIVINNNKERTDKVFENNIKTEIFISNNIFDIEILTVDAFSKDFELPKKFSGVGLARKIGFDLTLPFSNKSTIFCNLDADTLISKDYLKKINIFFNSNKHIAAVLGFKHQRSKSNYNHIIEYEKFLLDTSNKMAICGSPYYYYSIGSTIVCNANAYAAVGGMPRKKATEDFYFLEALAKYQSIGMIKEKLVYPSSRISNRIYLGTGFRMNQASNGFDLNSLRYSEHAFSILKKWLKCGTKSYDLSLDDVLMLCDDIHLALRTFLNKHNINSIWNNMKKSSPTEHHFEKQFHRWFDALKTYQLLKYFTKINI